LADLAAQGHHKYFSLGHRSVRFKQYVGILATPELTIEILPKVDRQFRKTQANWQSILIDLLHACHFAGPESIGTALVNTEPGALLDWYLRTFIAELKALLRQGLLHQYRNVSENLGVLKGRLNVSRQIRQNLFHQERFQVSYDRFTNRHPANVMIGAALQQLLLLSIGGELRTQLKYLAQLFPPPAPGAKLPLLLPEDLQKDRRLDRYARALTIARHVLQEERPDLRAGPFRGLTLLFDMNLLFEEYLYRQLLKWKTEAVRIERQQSTIFWGQNRLRPDLVIVTPVDRWVVDTKWRILPNDQPSADELRQIYVYCDYFKARRGMLVFPDTGQDQAVLHRPFSPLPTPAVQERSCQLFFARVLSAEGRLNRSLGKELLEEMGVSMPLE
jgi:5-methylcytosine-specific restriction enzyme subunit McrC